MLLRELLEKYMKNKSNEFCLVLLKSSKDNYPERRYFIVDGDNVIVKTRVNVANWENKDTPIAEARNQYKELVTAGWIDSKLFNEDKCDQDLPLTQDNCRHNTAFEDRCCTCGGWWN